MQQYVEMSYVYDQLTQDQPYDLWADIVRQYIASPSSRVLDIGCGTGQLTCKLATDAQVTGMDLSADMLAVASQKSTKVQWVEGDMSQLDLGQTYDVITILCDSLNYLPSMDEVYQTFQGVYEHLEADGTFIFDVHTVYKMDTAFNDQTYHDETEDVFLAWDALRGEDEHSVWHEMTFFIRQPDETYVRFDETHYQRTYDVATYVNALRATGFTSIEHFYDFDQNNQDETSQRLFFVVKK